MTQSKLTSMMIGSNGQPMAVIVSIFTPYQLLFLERYWAELGPRPLLILDSRAPKHRAARKPRIPGEVMELDLTGKVNDPDQALLVRQAATAAEDFAQRHRVCFICGSYQWPVNTTIFHRNRKNPDWIFMLQDDGLSTYLNLRPSPREKFRNIIREIVARVRGFPARTMVQGHPLGHDLPGLSAIILGLEPAHDTPGKGKVIVLPPQSQAVSYDGHAALFVGQPIIKDYGRDRLQPFLQQVAADLRARGYSRLAFKPHHFQPEEEIGLYLSAGFELFDPPLPVEEVIAESAFRTIAAVSSTALLTCKALFGDEVKAIAFNLTRFPPAHEKRDMTEVQALFQRAGVELVEL